MDTLDIAISSITFLSLKEKILLRKNIDTLDRLAVLSKEELSSIVGRRIKADWRGEDLLKLSEYSLKIINIKGISSVRYEDEAFPALLKEIFDPPYMLFYMGDISCLQKKCISVVGTRHICSESAQAALDFSRSAALDDSTVVSGLANGIDTFAHRGALSSKKIAATAAVLPCGIDTIVPSGNKKLAEYILKGQGCILSEYIPGTPAEKWRFVQRNRLIAALSPAVVVIQAPPGSGALITADFALEYNRDIFFHSACFCKEAAKLDAEARKKLSTMGQRGLEKIKRAPDAWIRDGAALVENYDEFVRAMKEAPGTYNIKKQMELF